jgi:hypothetical protein
MFKHLFEKPRNESQRPPVVSGSEQQAGEMVVNNSAASSEVDPTLLDRVRQLLDALLTSENRPSDDKPIFVSVGTASRSWHLTLELQDAKRRCLLLFTSQFRALDYIRVALGNDVDARFYLLSARECVSSVSSWLSVGVTDLVLNRCPRCDVMTVVPLDSLQSTDDFIRIWASTTASGMAFYDRNLERATAAFTEGRISDARDLAVEIVQHIDAERAEVHFLLGSCGILIRDDATVEQAFHFLGMFDQHWTDELREQKAKREQLKIKGIDY